MHFSYTGPINDLPNIVFPNPAAGHHDDPVCGSFDEPRDRCHTLQCRGPTSRGEHSADTGVNQCLHGLREILAGVERTVKRDRKSRRCSAQLARNRYIDLASGIERTDDDSIGTFRSRGRDITLHYFHLVARIHEVSGSRPDQNEHRDTHALFHGADQIPTRRRATVVEIRAQLDPRRACTLGGNRRVERFDCGFDESQRRFSEAISITKR